MGDKDDLRLLYQVLSSQIEFSKSQQWTISYYTLLFIGGLVGFSELIHKNQFGATTLGQIALFLLAVVALPIAMASVQLIWKNERTMCKNRERFRKMRLHLSWPFNDSYLFHEGPHLVGKGMDLSLYTSSIYDAIFWFPPMLLTCLASLISYVYLLVRFLKTAKIFPWEVLLCANLLLAVALSLFVLSIYRRWDQILERRAQGKGPKATSLSSIIRRIHLLVGWIYTGQIPPRTCSCPHALLIKWICKGQCIDTHPTDADKATQR